MEKEHLDFVIVGHVDHGKSTLIGRLLYDTHSIPESIIEDVRETSKEHGKEMEFAYLLDSLKEEREQNITIDTTQTFFNTDKRDYIIIDAPGHKEFLKNMITGASLASAGILMIDSSQGLAEQTRRHAYILSLLGVEQIIVAVNKMDLVDYKEEVYLDVKEKIEAFLKKINLTPLHVIPVSAKEGDNIASRSSNLPWYKGSILLEALDSLTAPESLRRKPLRYPVQDVYKVDGRELVVGRIECGEMRKGDTVEIYPSKEQAEIKTVEKWLQKRSKAGAGDSIGITLQSDATLKRGDVICTGSAPAIATQLDTTLFWMDTKPLDGKEQLTLKCATQEVPCVVENIKERIDSSTLEILGENTDTIGEAEAGSVTIRTEQPLVVEDFNSIEGLGRFVFVRNEDIVAGGIIHGWA
ncbi:GTP-binding protein [Oligoflexia bacterium]|nr:GTP-binding protein [Oligoflexia bacterium]